MNRTWMRDELAAYAELADRYANRPGGLYETDPKTEAWAAELRHREPKIKQILKVLDPDLASFRFDVMGGEITARNAAQRGIGMIEAMDEWAENLTPEAPSLVADRFHRWVWDAARTFWESKHYRAAVHAAATAINAHTQTKVGRNDISDTDLMNAVFNDKPKPGQAYLRFPGDPADRTVKTRNNALRPFAEGCFAGIRNPAAHEHVPDWDEQTALEFLAALSILARWIESCALYHAN